MINNEAETTRHKIIKVLDTIGIDCEVRHMGRDRTGDWDHNKWEFTLKGKRGKYTSVFRTGLGRKGVPGRIDVFSCVANSYNIPDTFQEFCINFGYEDAKPWEALETYNATLRERDALRRLLAGVDDATVGQLMELCAGL